MFQVFQMVKNEASDELVLADPAPQDEVRRVKKRNRVLQSCIPCHELRRKCDRLRPCTRCTEHGTAGHCVYQLEDPAARDPNADECTRLKNRVKELEHTVRVLMQRGSPEGGLDETIMAAITGRRSSPSEADDLIRKKGRRETTDTRSPSASSSHSSGHTTSGEHSPNTTTPSVRIPGAGISGHGPVSPSGSPSGGLSTSPSRPVRGMSPGLSGHSASQSGPTSNRPAHCGCALSPSGRAVLGQLQINLDGSIQRMKELPEHRIHGASCALYQQMRSFGEVLRNATHTTGGSPSSRQAPLLSTSTLQPSYQYLQGPTSSISPTSSSPPQDFQHHMSSLQSGTTYDLSSPMQPTHPYPFTASHSSTLSQSYQQSPYPSTTQPSYTQIPMAGMSTSSQGYTAYQPAGQPSSSQMPHQHHQRQSSASTLPYSGYTSLSTWNSMAPSSGGPSSNRPGSSDRQSRGGSGGSTRTAK